ncbi:MAG: CatB-related O-acetyltransferase [Sulfitobacter sp.]|nr:transferase [Roseobacter sp.]MBV49389.1 transferase [Roseobacter sp.]
MTKLSVPLKVLRRAGIEVLSRGTPNVNLPLHTVLEAPGSLKWTQYEHSIELGAFSYQVSGYCFAARIGRYCSFGEGTQIGRQNHPTHWASTSPAFYLGDQIYDLGDTFPGSDQFHNYSFKSNTPATVAKITTIGNDVWIGHGAYIAAGTTIGDGAIIGAHAVVTRDVPAYAVVAGNPATIKKMRLPPGLIGPMLQAQWWQFAPWQMDHLDPSDPEAFCKGVHKMTGSTPAYMPQTVDLREGVP